MLMKDHCQTVDTQNKTWQKYETKKTNPPLGMCWSPCTPPHMDCFHLAVVFLSRPKTH